MLSLSFSTVNMQHVLFNNFLQLPNLTHIQSCTSQPATISTLRHKNLQTANQPPSINPPARERSLVFCWTVFFLLFLNSSQRSATLPLVVVFVVAQVLYLTSPSSGTVAVVVSPSPPPPLASSSSPPSEPLKPEEASSTLAEVVVE